MQLLAFPAFFASNNLSSFAPVKDKADVGKDIAGAMKTPAKMMCRPRMRCAGRAAYKEVSPLVCLL